MILTVYYMYATILQWWRLGALKNKINGTLNSHNALLICTGTSICDTKKQRCLENLLFHHDDRVACTIVPKQKVNLSHWVSFPNDLKYFPIHISDHKPKMKYPNLFIQVQAVLETYTKHHSEVIQVENFGELIAWKALENFDVIIKTDIEHLAKLVHCLSQNSVDINHDLKLLKIETVDVEGNAIKIKYDKPYLLEQKLKYSYAAVHWKKFVSDVKQLYSKIHDTTNPKIMIENGCPKIDNAKTVPVSEVKPTKKEIKKGEDKNTLEVASTDHRRHKGSEHRREKTPDEKQRRLKDEHGKNKVQKIIETLDKFDSGKSPPKDSGVKTLIVSQKTAETSIIKSTECSKSNDEFKIVLEEESNLPAALHQFSTTPPKYPMVAQIKEEKTQVLSSTAVPAKSPIATEVKEVNGICSTTLLSVEEDGALPQFEASEIIKPIKSQKNKESIATATSSKSQSSKDGTSKCLIASVLSKTKESCKIKDRDKKDKQRCEDKTKVCDRSKKAVDLNRDKDKKEKVRESKIRDRSNENGEASTKNEENDKNCAKVKEEGKQEDRTRDHSTESKNKGDDKVKKAFKAKDKSKETAGKVKEKRRFDVRLGSKDKDKLSKSKTLGDTANTSKQDTEKIPETPSHKHNVAKSESVDSNQGDSSKSKPPNILVYADSLVAKENVKTVLQTIINKQKYTVYDLPVNSQNVSWNPSTNLIVVCGSVPPNLTSHVLQYLLNGGNLLCLCSDLLYSVLHTFTTAEVREHELVRFSYGEWRKVKMMHHIFCYQASPAKKQFSRDSDHSNQSSNGSSPVAPRTPSTVDIQHNGKDYTIQVQVLGAEETWQTPSLILAAVKNSKGTAIFSQVHLEIDPTQYEDDENKYEALKDSNIARLEIFRDILSNHLNIDCSPIQDSVYTPGYFLGRHELKLDMLSNCDSINDNQLSTANMELIFCKNNEDLGATNENRLPVLIHSCPSNFSTVQYFETLETNEIGRLVLYCDVISSSQYVLTKKLKHGFVVIPRQQTRAMGRSNNTWLSPLGSASFSLQLHIVLDSPLGRSLPLIQHLVMVAVVSAVKSIPGYEVLNIGIKWPNDLYANANTKIGGIIVSTVVESVTAIVNIGCGVNLSNGDPTICINDLIKSQNESTGTSLKLLSHETFFGRVFNELEKIYQIVQKGDLAYFYGLYYNYWLHSNAEITITTADGSTCTVNVLGIDDYGYLKVQSATGEISSVQPDGNTFDMMKGLVAPKIF